MSKRGKRHGEKSFATLELLVALAAAALLIGGVIYYLSN